MRHARLSLLVAKALLLAGSLLAPGASEALAATTNAIDTGATNATVVVPIRITAVDALRFGQIARPSTSGTLTITAAGAVSGTGGMLTSYAIAQTGGGKGPASFTVTGDPLRSFAITLPASFNIVSGARRMRVTPIALATPRPSLDASGNYSFSVGASLAVGANQTVGNYAGTYSVTVTYQ